MAEVKLTAEARSTTGSSESRRLRALGKIPAILYGHGVAPQPLAVDVRALRGALNQVSGLNALLLLQVESSQHLAMARQLQRHPVRGSVEHVDFVIVRRDEVVTIEVPVRLIGEASAVEKASGLVEQQLFALEVQAKPGDIPPAIEIDLTDLKVGDAVRVGDLKLPSGVATERDPEEIIVIATSSTTAAEVAADEEAAEGAEGAEGTSEGGGGEAGSPEG